MVQAIGIVESPLAASNLRSTFEAFRQANLHASIWLLANILIQKIVYKDKYDENDPDLPFYVMEIQNQNADINRGFGGK